MTIFSQLTMHGYGAYVWSAYAIGVLLLFTPIFFLKKSKKQMIKAIKRHFVLKGEQ